MGFGFIISKHVTVRKHIPRLTYHEFISGGKRGKSRFNNYLVHIRKTSVIYIYKVHMRYTSVIHIYKIHMR